MRDQPDPAQSPRRVHTDEDFDRPFVSAFERFDIDGRSYEADQLLVIGIACVHLDVRGHAGLSREARGLREELVQVWLEPMNRRLQPRVETDDRYEQDHDCDPASD